MVISIKKQTKNWAYLQILFVVFCGFLTSQLRLPSMISYVTDIITVILVVQCLRNSHFKLSNLNAKLPIVMLCLFIASSFVGTLYNFSTASVAHYFWGARNIGRVFIFMFCCVSLFDNIDIHKIIKFFDVLLWVNVVYCSFQYWVQGLWCDTVGGVFGTNYGCISYVNLHLCMMLIYHVSMYLNRKEKLSKTGAVVLATFYLATITELKAFFVEFIVILIVLVLTNRPSFKSIGILVAGFVGLYLGLQLISVVLPDAASVLSVDGLIENLTAEKGYTHSGDLSRFDAIPKLKQMFFSTDRIKEWFGFGLGNCETSSVGIFDTSFYHKYEYLNYRWFTHSMMYLEMGLVGLSLFYAFIASCIVYSFTIRKKVKDKVLWSCSLAFPIVIIICSMYNSSFRTEAGYITAFMLSLAFILGKSSIKATRRVPLEYKEEYLH